MGKTLWALESGINHKNGVNATLNNWFAKNQLFLVLTDGTNIICQNPVSKDIWQMSSSAKVTAKNDQYIRIESNNTVYQFCAVGNWTLN